MAGGGKGGSGEGGDEWKETGEGQGEEKEGQMEKERKEEEERETLESSGRRKEGMKEGRKKRGRNEGERRFAKPVRIDRKETNEQQRNKQRKILPTCLLRPCVRVRVGGGGLQQCGGASRGSGNWVSDAGYWASKHPHPHGR